MLTMITLSISLSSSNNKLPSKLDTLCSMASCCICSLSSFADTATVYLIAMATQLGCSVYTCTQDIENLHMLQSVFPDICVFHGGLLHRELMAQTKGAGVDICIVLSMTGQSYNVSHSLYTQVVHLSICLSQIMPAT